MGLEDRRQDALDQLEELTDDGEEIYVDVDPEAPEEEVEEEVEEENEAEEPSYLDQLRDEYAGREDDLRQALEDARNAREMRRASNERYEQANRLSSEAQRAQLERDQLIQALQSGGPDAVRQQFPQHFQDAPRGTWGSEEDDDPVARVERQLQVMNQRLQANEAQALRQEAERKVDSVLGTKDYSFLERRPKIREVVRQELLSAVFNPDNGVTDGNITAKVSAWARELSNDWRRELQSGREEYVEKKRSTKKKVPPSSKGPRSAPRTTPKRKKKLSFASRAAWKEAGQRALEILNDPDME